MAQWMLDTEASYTSGLPREGIPWLVSGDQRDNGTEGTRGEGGLGMGGISQMSVIPKGPVLEEGSVA